jgi:hypothetical protein
VDDKLNSAGTGLLASELRHLVLDVLKLKLEDFISLT